jgi:putative PIN family toxin of toxin-antitoxin system
VLIAALISGNGAPRALLWSWLEGAFELVACPLLLAELERVLLRPKFRAYVTAREVRTYVALLYRLAAVHPDPQVTRGLTPDPGDDYLVALARAAAAHFLVSGDSHLTRISRPQPPVLTPRAFLKLVAIE